MNREQLHKQKKHLAKQRLDVAMVRYFKECWPAVLVSAKFAGVDTSYINHWSKYTYVDVWVNRKEVERVIRTFERYPEGTLLHAKAGQPKKMTNWHSLISEFIKEEMRKEANG